jgi:uncharacterized OB-fold protein
VSRPPASSGPGAALPRPSASARPDLDWEPTREFWRAAQREELTIPRCDGCGAFVWYPQPACPRCGGEALAWVAVSGRGNLFSWAVVTRALFEPFAGKVPYVTGLIALAEDPAVRLVSNVVDCAASDLRVDMPLEVTFRPLEFPGDETAILAPMFRPTETPTR